MSLRSLIFSFEGRISRKTYWLSLGGVLFAPVVIWLVFAGLVKGGMLTPSQTTKAIFLAALLPLLVPALAVSIKRIHDRGRSWGTPAFLILLTYATLISERLFFFFYAGEPLFSVKDSQSIAFFSLAPVILTPIHGSAPVGAFVFFGNASKFVTSVKGGRWDIPTVFYLCDSLAGLILLVASAWYLWDVGFRRGTIGPNRYGHDPLQT